MKRNPRKLKWTKAYRKAAGKEMKVDSTFDFEKKRNRPVKYDRELMGTTLRAMKRVGQIQRARDYYKKAEEGIPMLAPDARFAVRASLDLYSRILTVIERNGYDNFNKRAYTTKLEKLSILPGSWQAANSAGKK